MPKFKQIDLARVRTVPIGKRKSKVTTAEFAKLYDPKSQPFARFIDSMPRILVADDLRSLVDDILRARRRRKPVILMIGAHVIKVGLSPLIVDLIRKNVVGTLAMNSAAAIHDVETAMWGKTSEDVAEYLVRGRFGMSRETGDFINGTLKKAFARDDAGYGEALGRELVQRRARNIRYSLLAECYTHNVPVTVHAAIGTDIVHQQPSMDGAATGELTFRDFKVLCNNVKDLGNGGVVLNVGSAVILPEVFLKALTVARNLGHNVKNFSTANFDMIRHYRPQVNVLERPTAQGGRAYNITGHHEIMVPLLCAMINARLRS